MEDTQWDSEAAIVVYMYALQFPSNYVGLLSQGKY